MTLTGIIGASLPFLFFFDEGIGKKGPILPGEGKVERCSLEKLEECDIQLTGQGDKARLDPAVIETLVADVIKDTGSRETVKIAIGMDTDHEFGERSSRFIPSVNRT